MYADMIYYIYEIMMHSCNWQRTNKADTKNCSILEIDRYTLTNTTIAYVKRTELLYY